MLLQQEREFNDAYQPLAGFYAEKALSHCGIQSDVAKPAEEIPTAKKDFADTRFLKEFHRLGYINEVLPFLNSLAFPKVPKTKVEGVKLVEITADQKRF